MYGVVTRNAEELEWPVFDQGFYEVKDVSGRQETPVETGINMVSCHGDSRASKNDELVPVDDAGRPATRDRRYFDWGYVCPSHPTYRSTLLDVIESCANVNGDVRLDDVGFPRKEYCYCRRCVERFEQSEFSNRLAWRGSVVSGFLGSARERVPGRLYLTVYPDPYPGHLYERTGIDLAVAERYVDEFVIPIYDMGYTTTYWLEILARGFTDTLDTPFSIELYAVEVGIENLVHAAEVAEAYADAVYFSYDAGNAQKAIEQLSES